MPVNKRREGIDMKIDLTCPVELWQYALPNEKDTECTFVMNNLSDKVVTSVQVTLNCFDQKGELIFRQTERAQGLKAGVGERFSVVVVPAEWQGVNGVDLVIEKVWFDDATVWRKGNAPLAAYEPNALPAGRALDELRFVAGKDAVGYPQMQAEVWLCVCGRPNAGDSQRCCRCERRRDAVFASFNRENVKHLIAAHEQKLADAARKVREENTILQENREKKHAAKRRRSTRALRLGVSLLLAAVAAVVAFVWLIPTARYNTAADLLSQGEYDRAKEAFVNMGDYRDAAQQALECEYQKAADLYAQGDAENMEQAVVLFAALADYADSAEKVPQVKYDLGCLYLENAKYEQAVEKFQQIIDYGDSAEKLNETVYRQAKVLLDAQNYVAARVLFAGLADYSDARDMTRECNYRMAEAKLEAGDYQGALSIWNLLGEYSDTAERIGECYYALAEEQLAQGAYEVAGEWFVMAGSYSDAQERANESFYQLAQEKRAAGDYDGAISLFMRAPAYRDGEAMAMQCVYEKAEAMLAANDPLQAALLFESIPGYNDAQERLDECRYMMAQTALAEGKKEEAETLLAQMLDAAAVEEELQALRYELAKEAQKAGEYQKALERYEQLGAYKDSRTQAKNSRYSMAKAALESGDYDLAIAGFTQLGSYKDSKKLLSTAQKKQKGEAETPDGQPAEETEAIEEPAAEETVVEEAVTEEPVQQEPAVEESIAEEPVTEEPVSDAQAARNAMAKKDYETVVSLLWEMDFDALEPQDSDLVKLFEEACIEWGDKLYSEGRPYEAMAYYERVNAQEKLSRKAYLILGEWESVTGKKAVFREDGTCDLMGEELYFRVSNFSLYTGLSADDMTVTHKLSVLTQNGMSLRDQRNGKDVLYKMSRVEETAAPEAEEAEVPATEDADAADE